MKDPICDYSSSFDEEYFRLKSSLDQWHSNLIEQVEAMYLNTLIQLDTSYERFETFRETLRVLLDDQTPIDRPNAVINASDYVKISSRLSWIENETDYLSNISYRVNVDQVRFLGRPCLNHLNQSFELHSSTIPCRILLPREDLEQLSDAVNKSLYTYFTHSSAPEAIVQMTNLQQLPILIEPILSIHRELRVLIHESYAPLILGQLGNRARMFKEKYGLTVVQIYPTCAPLSTERVLLLSGPQVDQILRCLIEIYSQLSQIPLMEKSPPPTFLYSPEFYDFSIVEDYGGYFDRQISRSISNETQLNEDDDLSEYEDEDVEDFDPETTNYPSESNEPLRERHWTLSDAQAGALFGPNSSRLHQIRSESNAWIVIYEAQGKNSRRPMSIRGTKAEIEHATKLILETIKRHDRKLPLKHNQKRNK